MEFLSVWLTLQVLAAPADTMVVPLKEVVVTGTRVPESVLRAPAAISVVEREGFDNTRAMSLKDVLVAIPGVFVQSRAGAQDVRVTIRGFGARGNGERSNAGNMRGIRVVTDGVPVTEPDGRTSTDLMDIGVAGRVEVVRSNVSTLYGNASGGVVHLRTDFGFRAPYVEFRERLGDFGYHREQVETGFTIGPGRGVLSLLNSTYDGWRAHSASTAALAQARLQLPLDSETRLGVLLDATHSVIRFPGALTSEQLAADPRQADPSFVARDERRDHRVGRVALSLDRAVGAAQDLALTLYVEPKSLQRSERRRFRDFTRYHIGGSGTYELRARLAPDLESVTLLGADEALQDGSILFYTLGPGGSRGDTLKADKREAANSAGLFVQQQFRWRERWSVRLGGRFDHLRYASEDHMNPALDARKTFTRWTPKGSLAYASDFHTVYAALGGGVEAPAFNEIDPPPEFRSSTSFNPLLEAMHSTTYELGAKGRLLQAGSWGSLLYDAALYWIEVRNELVPFGGGAYFFTAGRSRRRGFELGLNWLPVESLRLQGAATLSDNEYLSYRNDLGDFGGAQTPGLPRATVAGSARLDAPAGTWAEVSVEHVGEYFADDANTARADAYTLLGATVGLERGIGALSLRAFTGVQNLTDEPHVASVFINGVNGKYYEPGLPRSWTAGLSLRWR